MKIVAMTALGGLTGSLLLLVSSNAVFATIVPFLLAIATLIFGSVTKFRNGRARAVSASSRKDGRNSTSFDLWRLFQPWSRHCAADTFSLWGMRDINVMNGLKSGLSFVLSAILMATFAAARIAAWPQAAVMIVAATLGGYVGARVGLTCR